jgi:hypothetical protein
VSVFDSDFGGQALRTLIEVHGEPVTYHPAEGTPRDITAIVNRDPAQVVDVASGIGPTARATMLIINDENDGISLGELETSGDEIEYPVEIGQSPSRRPLADRPQQRGGGLILGVL